MNDRKTLSRRDATLAIVGAGFALGAGDARAQGDLAAEGEEAYLDFLANAEEIDYGVRTRALTATQRETVLRDIAEGRLTAAWAPSSNHPDYRHHGVDFSPARFALTHDVLASMTRHNFLMPTSALTSADPVIFGLRGCTHAQNVKSATGSSIDLVEALPDHVNRRCIIGVWRPAQRTLTTFSASTVPALHDMAMSVRDGEKPVAMQSLGRHVHAVGTHSRNSGEGRAPGAVVLRQQPGALLLNKRSVVLRLGRDASPMMYTFPNAARKVWWDTSGNDTLHIHGGGQMNTAYRKFSSAGCQTLFGDYGGGPPNNEFRAFREALGLGNVFVGRDILRRERRNGRDVDVRFGGRRAPDAEEGRQFTYLLLTGRDARLHAAHVAVHGAGSLAPDLLRMRFGSVGPAVAPLHTRLGGATNRIPREIDPALLERYRAWQVRQDAWQDCVVTPDLAQRIGVNLAAAYNTPSP